MLCVLQHSTPAQRSAANTLPPRPSHCHTHPFAWCCHRLCRAGAEAGLCGIAACAQRHLIVHRSGRLGVDEISEHVGERYDTLAMSSAVHAN
jgi:hypothetical protein